MKDAIDILMENLSQSIVGQTKSIRIVLVALLSGGHALLEDVPGVGKTLLAKSLARSINGRFQRVPGPAFANVLLADEINRATPRTQSALLEVMEEKQVTIDGEARPVPQPFFVIATQNPIEYQGTFPLPEAQMDRFAVCLSLGYPSATEELTMLQRQHSQETVKSLEACISLEEVGELQRLVSLVKVAPALQQYIVDLVRATRDHEDISLGVSPRGCVVLQKAVQAYAFLEGRDYAIPDDVKFITPYVFCHRLIPSHGRQAKAIVERLLQSVAIEDRICA
ncbi:MAG: MoxR family ATPase [Microcystis aeruginosa G11-06]|nr:MoxR family ATPase [Microcystis aeruginosa G11-06]